MLKKTITYTDFNDQSRTEDFYFNLTEAELAELELTAEGNKGLQANLQAIMDSNDNAQIVAKFKEIILMAYGEKSDDGRRFIKSEEIKTAFTQTNAYSQLFVELATDPKAADAFIRGIVPQNLKTPEDHKPKEVSGDKVVESLPASDPDREEFERWKASQQNPSS